MTSPMVSTVSISAHFVANKSHLVFLNALSDHRDVNRNRSRDYNSISVEFIGCRAAK